MQIDESNSIAHVLHNRFLVHSSKPFLGAQTVRTTNNGCQCIEYNWETYARIHQRTAAIASSMVGILGLTSRAAIGLCGPNIPQILIADFACCFNDLISVGLHHCWDEISLAYVLNITEIQCIFCMAVNAPKFIEARSRCPHLSHLIIMDDGFVESAVGLQIHQWSTLDAEGMTALSSSTAYTLSGAGIGLPSWFGSFDPTGKDKLPRIPPGFSEAESEPFTLLFTSGTSGLPKGVVVTKKRWLRDATVAGMFAGQSDPTVLSYMSFAHGGINYQMFEYWGIFIESCSFYFI